MTKSLNNATIETLIEKASSYITDKDDLNKIREVYEYAKEKHQDSIARVEKNTLVILLLLQLYLLQSMLILQVFVLDFYMML